MPPHLAPSSAPSVLGSQRADPSSSSSSFGPVSDAAASPAASASASTSAVTAPVTARLALHNQRIVKPRPRQSPSSSASSSASHTAHPSASASASRSSPSSSSPSSSSAAFSSAPFLARLRHYLAGALLPLTSVSSLSHFTASLHSFTSGPAWLLGSRYRSLANSAYHPVSMQTKEDAHDATSHSVALSHSNSHSHSAASSTGRSALLSDVGSRLWFSYRSSFTPLSPDPTLSLTSDAGWGCMLRSTQMLFAYALTVHYLGRQWRRQAGIADKKHAAAATDAQHATQHRTYLAILALFLDSPSAPYSIHSLLGAPSMSPSPSPSAATASSSPAVPFSPSAPSTPRAGEWFGPTATCHMLLRCRAAQVAAAGGESQIDVPALLVSDDGTLYEDEIMQLCQAAAVASAFSSTSASPASSTAAVGGSFRPIVLLIPVRLGADRINDSYIEPLLACFQFSQSLGMMGGKPRSSYWFIGVQDDRVLYLDPHTVQPAVALPVDGASAPLSTAACSTFHTQQLYSMPAQQLDPSMALGFYIGNLEEWQAFVQHARALEDKCAAYALVRVKHTRGWRPTDSDERQQQQQQQGQHDASAGQQPTFQQQQRSEHSTPQRWSAAASLSDISASLRADLRDEEDSDDDDEFVLL